MTAKVRTCLWFDKKGEEAAKFYVSLLAGSRIDSIYSPNPDEPPLIIEFTLAGTPYLILNGGPMCTQSEAVSICVSTKDQDETDFLWHALIADGGSESQCAWLKDRFGVSWQIVPEALPRLLSDQNREAANRVMQAMMSMQKIDVEKLEVAFKGD